MRLHTTEKYLTFSVMSSIISSSFNFVYFSFLEIERFKGVLRFNEFMDKLEVLLLRGVSTVSPTRVSDTGLRSVRHGLSVFNL